MAHRARFLIGIVATLGVTLLSGNASAQKRPIDPDKARVIEHWTPERRAAAIPRDLVIDHRGLGYMKRPDGRLVPYGHSVPAEASRGQPPEPFAKPGGGGGGTTDKVTNAHWTTDSAVKNAAGRIYFEMPDNLARSSWGGYVCSGTVTNGGDSERSLIITAAHCVYDDVNKAFARNVMFIPNQDDTTGSRTDSDCTNDPLGCWVPSFGVVDVDWTNKTWPSNIPWDYAFYVVNDSGAHYGNGTTEPLDTAAGFLTVSFSPPGVNKPDKSDFTYALGYSYKNDPNFMYCAQDMTTTNGSANWWLSSCRLSGGSSGGPWVQDGTNQWAGGNDGSIISVNSWGYAGGPGMAGPKLSGTTALCIFNSATTQPFPAPSPAAGDAGYKITCL